MHDCILMDSQLAGEIGGIEAAQQIHGRAAIPIIFMTGYPDKTVAADAATITQLNRTLYRKDH